MVQYVCKTRKGLISLTSLHAPRETFGINDHQSQFSLKRRTVSDNPRKYGRDRSLKAFTWLEEVSSTLQCLDYDWSL